jgi:hypothetical protein
MKMVRDETKTCQLHRHLLVSLSHKIQKRRKVIVFVKDVTAAIAPVQDMVNKPTS